jgi:hypothetical protein
VEGLTATPLRREGGPTSGRRRKSWIALSARADGLSITLDTAP